MAVGTAIVWNRRFEISVLVTAQAGNVEMFAEQWIAGFRMIEGLGEARSLPSQRGVAGVASLLECSFVRVAMAVGATGEGQACITSLTIRPRGVATLAFHVAMLAGKRVARFRMIEGGLVDGCGFPIGG